MALISQTVEYLLIILGISSGAIATYIFISWIFGQIRESGSGSMYGMDDGDDTKRNMEDNDKCKDFNDGLYDISASSSGETEEMSHPSPERSREKPIKEGVNKVHSRSHGETIHDVDDLEEGYDDVLMMEKSSSLLDMVVAEEGEDESESGDDDDGDGGDDEMDETASDASSVKSAAELAAAWKLRAWSREHDSLALGSSSSAPLSSEISVNEEDSIMLFPSGIQFLRSSGSPRATVAPRESVITMEV